MWEDDYRVEQDDIKAPEFLKVKALQKMSESRSDYRKFFKLKPVWGVAFSCLVVMVVALNWMNIFDQDSELVTSIVFERLDGGLLHLAPAEDGDQQLTLIERGAVGDVGNQDITLLEAESVIGVSGADLYFEGFHLEDVSWIVEEDHARVQYFFEREDSSIRVMLNNHTDSVLTNSMLDGLPLALYYRVVLLERVFIAEFLYGEVYYQVEVVGVTEEAFVDYLKEVLNFVTSQPEK